MKTKVSQSRAFVDLSKAVPRCVALPSKPPLPAASSVYAVLMNRLIVLDDIVNVNPQKPYAWSPIQVERGKPGNTLDDWFLLPFGGPGLVILPGFHTAAENGMKRAVPGMAGAQVFFSVLGLMSNGAKTILLSRWRTGGQSSYDIVREFARTAPYHAGRRLAAGRAGHRRQPPEPRCRAPHQEGPPFTIRPAAIILSSGPATCRRPRPETRGRRGGRGLARGQRKTGG